MNTLTGIICNTKNSKYSIVQQMPIQKFLLDLGRRTWWLGLDPASRYMGIALYSGDFIVLLDCKRDTKIAPYEFYEDLFYLIKRLVSGQEIECIVNEKPFSSKYTRANEVLIGLRGKIEMWVNQITELSNTRFEQVYPNVWKSRVIDKKKGKNRFNEKGAIAEDLCDMFPPLFNYYRLGIAGDYDSFDALGAIIGFKKYAFTDDGYEKISGSKEKTHYSFVGYDWIEESELESGHVLRILGPIAQYVKPVLLEYNEDYNLVENVMMATSNHDAVLTIIPQDQLQQFQWKFGINITQPGYVLLMFMFRKGHYSASEFKAIEAKFEFSEEYGGRA